MGVRGCGRKPKSAQQHLEDGTFRKHRHAKRVDGQLGGTSPIMSARLKAEGKKLWETIVRRMPRSVLDENDTAKLDLICRTWDMVCGTSDPVAFVKLAQLFDRLGRQFGLSPMDRASLKTEPEPEEDDPAEAYRQKMAGLKVTG